MNNARTDITPETLSVIAEALGNIADPRAVPPLLELLKSENTAVIISTIQSLLQHRDPRAVEPLIALLSAQTAKKEPAREQIRALSAATLGEIGDLQAVSILIDLLNENTDVGYEAALALGKIGDKRAVMPLLAVLQNPQSYNRGPAALSLGRLKDMRAYEPLLAIAKNNDSHEQFLIASVILALGNFDNPEIVPLLRKASTSQDANVRNAVINVFSDHFTAQGVDILVTELKDGSHRNYLDAIRALGNSHEKKAIDPLVALLPDTRPEVQKEVILSLTALIGKNLGGDPATWISWWRTYKNN